PYLDLELGSGPGSGLCRVPSEGRSRSGVRSSARVRVKIESQIPSQDRESFLRLRIGSSVGVGSQVWVKSRVSNQVGNWNWVLAQG
ncbi:hypothetical protein HAX54_017934, partial [Datura stramonium]|nr:hypothetical protein [Datura stramonium]